MGASSSSATSPSTKASTNRQTTISGRARWTSARRFGALPHKEFQRPSGRSRTRSDPLARWSSYSATGTRPFTTADRSRVGTASSSAALLSDTRLGPKRTLRSSSRCLGNDAVRLATPIAGLGQRYDCRSVLPVVQEPEFAKSVRHRHSRYLPELLGREEPIEGGCVHILRVETAGRHQEGGRESVGLSFRSFESFVVMSRSSCRTR